MCLIINSPTLLTNLKFFASQMIKKEVALWHQIGEDTAIRELKILVQLGIIRRQSTGKATHYALI